MVLTPTGVGGGILAALGLTRLMSSLLYGVRPTGTATFVPVSFVLIGIAFLASYLPARRTMKVDPVAALRHEQSRDWKIWDWAGPPKAWASFRSIQLNLPASAPGCSSTRVTTR
jgi:hypothetical protein